MAAPTYSCNLNTLINNSKCFGSLCTSETDREGIEIYVAVQELFAVGGTDYRTNLTKLLTDAALWVRRSDEELRRVALYQSIQNAINNGASISTSINTLILNAKCFTGDCLGKEQLRGVLSYLKCSLGTRNIPEGSMPA
jgi:hypothetical protein